jgi:hypothetical protein
VSDRRLGPRRALLALAALLAAGGARAAAPAPPRLEVERLLDTRPLGRPLAFDVRADGGVLLVADGEVLDGATGRPWLAAPVAGSGALDLSGGAPRLLAAGGLFALDGRRPRLLAEAALAGGVLAVDGPRAWIAGVTPDGRAVLFLHEEGKGHRPVLEVEEPIDAMAAGGGALFFASGRAVWTLREGQPAQRLLRVPGLDRITSLALDARRGVLYFSDGQATHAFRRDGLVLLHRALGGTLRLRGDDLWILSWREGSLSRLPGLAARLAQPGGVAPWQDPCLGPVVGLHCRALAERALLDAIGDPAEAGGRIPGADAASLARVAEARRASLAALESDLARDAAAGAVAVAWTIDADPVPIGATPFATGGRGAFVSLWNGRELRLGAASTLAAGGCRPGPACRLGLRRGLLHLAPERAAAGGAPGRRSPGFLVETGGLLVALDGAEAALFASEEATAVLVLGGRARVRGAGPEDLTVLPGELLEVRPGTAPGAPVAVDAARINRWWEAVP